MLIFSLAISIFTGREGIFFFNYNKITCLEYDVKNCTSYLCKFKYFPRGFRTNRLNSYAIRFEYIKKRPRVVSSKAGGFFF